MSREDRSVPGSIFVFPIFRPWMSGCIYLYEKGSRSWVVDGGLNDGRRVC